MQKGTDNGQKATFVGQRESVLITFDIEIRSLPLRGPLQTNHCEKKTGKAFMLQEESRSFMKLSQCCHYSHPPLLLGSTTAVILCAHCWPFVYRLAHQNVCATMKAPFIILEPHDLYPLLFGSYRFLVEST